MDIIENADAAGCDLGFIFTDVQTIPGLLGWRRCNLWRESNELQLKRLRAQGPTNRHIRT